MRSPALVPTAASVLVALAGLLQGESALAQTKALKPGPPDVVAVQTRDLEVEFAGDRAWTIRRIVFKGDALAEKVGFYGTVFAAEGARWIGTGHNEGGIEKVGSTELTVDGTKRELTDKSVYRGARAELRKHSMMGPFRLEAHYVVTDDYLFERHRYEATEDVKVGTLYAFMHPWIPRTTEWLAQLPDGTLREGKFDSVGDHELRDDPKWTAVYDPVSQKAMLCWYPVPLAGQGNKTSYWDKTVYHKLYNQVYSHVPVAAGTKLDVSVLIRGVEAGPADWKAAIQKLAAETQQRYESGELRF